MKEYIETWKVLVLALEFFCVGGVTFSNKNSKLRGALFIVVLLCGFVLIATS